MALGGSSVLTYCRCEAIPASDDEKGVCFRWIVRPDENVGERWQRHSPSVAKSVTVVQSDYGYLGTGALAARALGMGDVQVLNVPSSPRLMELMEPLCRDFPPSPHSPIPPIPST
ncbi:hypothetical protein LTR60_006495, partial [Cryomyces antarcticus]